MFSNFFNVVTLILESEKLVKHSLHHACKSLAFLDMSTKTWQIVVWFDFSIHQRAHCTMYIHFHQMYMIVLNLYRCYGHRWTIFVSSWVFPHNILLDFPFSANDINNISTSGKRSISVNTGTNFRIFTWHLALTIYQTSNPAS